MCKAGVLVSILHLLRDFKVDMSGQELTTVPQTIDITVDRLILSNNQLITLDVGSFKRYVNLLELNMNNCEIKFIYEGTFLMQVKLMKLFLKFNKIKYLPGDFGPSVSTLIDLQLYGGLFKKYQLKDPYFSTFNRLRTVVIGGEVIDVSNVTIPASLIKFQAANMALKIFPNFSKAVVLEKVSMPRNKFSFIPDEHIKTIKGPVMTLGLHENNLQKMSVVSHLINLKDLWFRENAITIIPRNTIEGLIKLKRFNFAMNNIRVMPNISYLSSLEKIILEFNCIRFIPKSALCGLPKLTMLNLTANQISSLEDLPVLAPCDVFIGSNQIVSLPDLFDKTLRKLYISGNPFLCDHSLCWLRMLPWFKTLPNVDSPLCAQPPDLQGVSVLKVHPVMLECYRG